MFGFFHRNATSGITIGTVTTGNTASAEITLDGKLNLVLPAMSQQAEERLTAVETQLASVEQTAQGAADDAAALTTEIQDVRSDYAADIEAARSALQGSIDTVNATVSQHTTSISTAQRTAEAAQASASSLRGDITTLQDDVQTAQSTANTAQTAAEEAALTALKTGLELIWENSDLSKEVGEKDISFGSKNVYDAFLVEFCSYAQNIQPTDPNVNKVCSAFVTRGHANFASFPVTEGIDSEWRTGYYSRSIFCYSDGYSMRIGRCSFSYDKVQGYYVDSRMIPFRIYGIRKISTAEWV